MGQGQDNKDNYTTVLHNKLSNLVTPDSLNCQDPHCQDPQHKTERDSYVLDIMSAIIETSHETVPLSGGKKNTSNPSQNCPVEKTLPGWREEAAPFKEDALFWHTVTVSGSLLGLLTEVYFVTSWREHAINTTL